ncbi:MAG TPA: hypothetical protein VK735_45125 [Pseudonocardia sp.]|uniref:hypothetical protein n=1 Tax=Pseudonocardia sp. TaxID=60912 RepID=UPI002D09B167|nr:hypothetical protein [Pseudonocardia sp.]HTF54670.1 hypothetical protein [Pseudonocardia sp.]
MPPGVAVGVSLGVAVGVPRGVSLGVAVRVALGVLTGVALGVPAGVALGVRHRAAGCVYAVDLVTAAESVRRNGACGEWYVSRL